MEPEKLRKLAGALASAGILAKFVENKYARPHVVVHDPVKPEQIHAIAKELQFERTEYKLLSFKRPLFGGARHAIHPPQEPRKPALRKE